MCRKLIFLISVVLVLGLLNGASAATITWTGEAPDNNSWCDGDNWDGGDVPGSGDTALIDWSSPERGPIIGIGCDVDVGTIQGPQPAYPNSQVLDINTSGTVDVGAWVWSDGTGTATININGTPTITIESSLRYWRAPDNGTGILNISGDPDIVSMIDIRGADGAGSLYINMSGGRLECQDDLMWGDNGGGELNLSGGSIIVGDNLDMGGYRGVAPITINMTGGSISVGGKLLAPGSASRAGVVSMNLHGGVIDCNEFVHGGSDGGEDEPPPDPTFTDDWRLDIEQGTLKIKGDVTATINANIAGGQISAYDYDGTVNVEFVDGNTVVTGVPPDANTARNPSPPNRSKNVEPDVVLSWTPGVNAADVNAHDVYFGTDFEDVNVGTGGTFMGGQNRDANTFDTINYDPCGLELDTTYYWRIDEVNDNDPCTWTGRVWHFTTRSLILDPNLLIWYKYDEHAPNTVAYDSSGHGNDGPVCVAKGEPPNWDPDGQFDGCLIFDEYTLVQPPPTALSNIDKGITFSVWLKDAFQSGADNWVFDTGAGGEQGSFHVQAAVVTATEQDVLWRAGNDSCDVLWWNLGGRDPAKLEGWHHWAFVKDEREDKMYIYFDGELAKEKSDTIDSLANVRNTPFKIGAQTWESYGYAGAMDDFRVFDYAMSAGEVAELYRGGDLGFAWAPYPGDFEKEVVYDVELSWKPGNYVRDPNAHEVYFGTNFDDVNDANNSWPVGTSVYKGAQNIDSNSYDPPGLLDLGRLYYWRVDEVNDSNNDTWKGRVWKFTVAEYITVDDMEDYDNIWDGWYYGSDTLSNAELSLWKTSPVRGEQTMKFTYDNSIPFDPYSGLWYFSEIESKNLDPNDWTEFDLKRLAVWFYGESDNAVTGVEPMFLAVEDYNNVYVELRYGDGEDEDADDITIEAWQEWTILLSSLNDANLASLRALFIRFGEDRFYPFEGGYGFVYFDDIRVYPSVCVPERRKPAADLNNDCIVNFTDVEIMAGEWLEVDVNLGQVQAPKDANLVGWWKLDDGSGSVAADSSSSYNNPGTIQVIDVNVFWVAGYDGNALEFNGGRVRVPDAQELRPLDQVSVCAWIYYSERQSSARAVVKGPDNRESYSLEVDNDSLIFQVRDGNDPNAGSYPRYAAETDDDILDRDEWIHVAGTYDGNSLKCYINGEVAATEDANAIVILSQDSNDLAIGSMSDDDRAPFRGTIDDVRVYDYGLSQEEIGYIAADGEKIFTVQSVANLYNDEDLGKRAVNFRDFAVIADGWLEKKLWPE